MTVTVENRPRVEEFLRQRGVESGRVHFRNDRYSIFAESRGAFPAMDELEDKYMVVPLHTKLSVDDVDRVCQLLVDATRL